MKIMGIDRLRMETDGEGVTTLVVSAGCPLRCAFCLNPITWDGSFNGKDYSVEELYDALKIDNLYFLSTGGGVTFGGGEPLLHASFLREFILKYKKVTGWKFDIESSLSVPRKNLEAVIDLIDYFYIDTKDMDKERYEKYTCGDYDLFSGNLSYLLEKRGSECITVKVPKIPYFHKEKEWLENVECLKKMGFDNIYLFDYIEPDKRKKVSDSYIAHKNKFLENLKNE